MEISKDQNLQKEIVNKKEEQLDSEKIDKPQSLQDARKELVNKEKENTELINSLTHEINLMQDKLLRAVAESENIRSRMNKKVEEVKDYSIINFTKDLLPVIDNFYRTLSYSQRNVSDESKIIIDGIKMIKTELLSVLEKHGIKSINPKEGDTFDYNNHHAISKIVTDQYADGTIVSTMQIGYKIKDRLIRPASVAVAKN